MYYRHFGYWICILGKNCAHFIRIFTVCNFERPFERINWVMLMAILADIGVDCSERNLIKALYINQKAFVMVGKVFIIYDEAVVREVCQESAISVRVGGKIVNMIRYADDKAVVASSQKGLQDLTNRLNAIKKEYGTKINVKKTKVMCIS